MTVAEFADRVTLQVQAGHGGNGCASIHREKYKPLGGPDGGNGGRGGSVILEVDASTSTLLDFHRRPVRKAANGVQGEGSNRTGADAADLVIPVPNGTEVKTADGEVLADLIGVGTRFVAAAGGRGGLGNAALASPRRKAPGFALTGEPGEQRDLILELKTVADVGLVGFPNAGKSSLISAMSAARPKIANYPFTTLIPNLGVVEAGDVQFVVADVPGLIPGASRGKGLGHDFLRHVERCSILVHVLDCATEEPGRDPITDLPGFALKGEPGERRELVLELKTVADVGLIGFPNAGKSSLVAAMSAARPKIANYPFTTLIPNLGVVEAGDVQFVVADVPGLIPGASRGKGLGHDFLRHVERCSILVHVLDCATEEPGRDPITDLDVIEEELAAYGDATGAALLTRPRLVALNKIDVPAARDMADLVQPDLEKRGYQVFEISAATGEGLRPRGFARAALVAADRAARPAEQPAERRRVRVKVQAADEPGFEVVRLGDSFLIMGEKPRRWVQQTDFSNDEAVGYLADRLARLGVEVALAEAGAEPGAEVLIGDPDDAVVFDWDPAAPMASGASGASGGARGSGPRGRHGPRGTDPRLSP